MGSTSIGGGSPIAHTTDTHTNTPMGVKQSILQTLRLPACKEGRYDNRGNLDCIENVDCIGNPHAVQKVKIREAQSYAGSRYTS